MFKIEDGKVYGIIDRFHKKEEEKEVRSDNPCWGEERGQTFFDWCSIHGAYLSEIYEIKE